MKDLQKGFNDSNQVGTMIRQVIFLLATALLLVGTTSAEPYIKVEYSGKIIDQISSETPGIGKTFLLVNITLTNHGYQDVGSNSLNFNVESNKIRYGYDWASFGSVPILM